MHWLVALYAMNKYNAPFGELNLGSAYEDVNIDWWVSILKFNPIFDELVENEGPFKELGLILVVRFLN